MDLLRGHQKHGRGEAAVILEDIESKLREVAPCVYYGMVDKSRKETEWNYIVFNRKSIKHSGNRTADTDYFDVHIIRENYIPDKFEDGIITRLCALPGVRLASADSVYQYVAKPNTNIVVEMLTISFIRARK